MEQKYHIELIEEHDHVNFYSIHLEEEELSELERFFEKFPEGCASSHGWTGLEKTVHWNVISALRVNMVTA